MTADALAMPLVPDFMEFVESHFRRELGSVVEEWSRCTRLLAHWENQYLVEEPTPERLAAHKQAIERLLRFGEFLLAATEQDGLSDPATRDIVRATQTCLHDKLSLWHGRTLTEPERADLLKACFNES